MILYLLPFLLLAGAWGSRHAEENQQAPCPWSRGSPDFVIYIFFGNSNSNSTANNTNTTNFNVFFFIFFNYDNDNYVPMVNLDYPVMTASPSNAVSVGAPVNLTCQFGAPIYPNVVYFTLPSSNGDPNGLMYDTSTMSTGMAVTVTDNFQVISTVNSVTLMFLKTVTAETGSYQCFVSSSTPSNSLQLTVVGSESDSQEPDLTLIIAIVVPVVILVLAIVAIVLIVVVFRCHSCQIVNGKVQIKKVHPNVSVDGYEVKDSKSKAFEDEKPAFDFEKTELPPSYVELVHDV